MPGKVQTQVSVDADLLDLARVHHVDLSATLEGRLRHMLAERQDGAWQAANAGAIADANAFLARHGLWSDGKRQF